MVDAGRGAWALVPVPDVGYPPEGYSPSGLVLAVAAFTILAVLAFVAVGVAAPALGRRGVSPLRPALVAGAALVVGVVALGVLVQQGQSRAEDEADAFADEEDAAREAATEAIQATYGVRFPDAFLVTSVREAAVPVEVTLPDGTVEECLLGTYDRVYELRCGAPTWDDAEPLPMVEDEAS